MPIGSLPPRAAKLFDEVYRDELGGECKKDKACASKRAWGAVKNAGYFKGKDGKLEALEVVQVEWEYTPIGRPLKFKEIPGTKEIIPADMVLLALGFTGVSTHDALGLNLGDRGTLQSDNSNGVFVVGDCAGGASLVVRAIAHSREIAKDINNYLSR